MYLYVQDCEHYTAYVHANSRRHPRPTRLSHDADVAKKDSERCVYEVKNKSPPKKITETKEQYRERVGLQLCTCVLKRRNLQTDMYKTP